VCVFTQRAGRAGRTGAGHCYRLYSSAVYNDYFPQFAEPEVLRVPLDATVLMMKAMNIDNAVNFPFPTPPDRDGLKRAEKVRGSGDCTWEGRAAGANSSLAVACPRRRPVLPPQLLVLLAALKPDSLAITDLGRAMAAFPLAPRFAKMCALTRCVWLELLATASYHAAFRALLH